MPTEGERLARVEAVLDEVRSDVHEVRAELELARKRLHSLEGISSSFLAWQKDAREKEAAQYRRLANRIGWSGLAVSVGLLVLAVVTVLAHKG